MDTRKKHESMDDILTELRFGCPCENMNTYLKTLADRIEAAHAAGVLKAMDELMGK